HVRRRRVFPGHARCDAGCDVSRDQPPVYSGLCCPVGSVSPQGAGTRSRQPGVLAATGNASQAASGTGSGEEEVSGYRHLGLLGERLRASKLVLCFASIAGARPKVCDRAVAISLLAVCTAAQVVALTVPRGDFDCLGEGCNRAVVVALHGMGCAATAMLPR